LTVKPSGANAIAGNGDTLVYKKYDDFGVNFDLLKEDSGQTYKITFDIMNYFAKIVDDIGHTSGAYLFVPSDFLQESVRYTSFRNITTYNGGFVQEMFLTFTSDSIYRNATAYVRVRYYDESYGSEWEVYLSGLPNDNHGREVTVNWKALNFDNNKTFYTDSNGLEMQKRILNYRPSFNFSSFEQTSGNYYPINSALAIIDEKANLQMTVLNDRSQGGSSLQQGRLELMQNRRLFIDDNRGVCQALNETDEYGNGISVPARYTLLFTERKLEISKQRELQLHIDEPLQYFYSFNWTSSQTEADIEVPEDTEDVKRNKTLEVALPKSVKYKVFPMNKNQLFVRLENIGDKFDTDHWNLNQNATKVVFPLDSFIRDLFNQSNPSKKYAISNITYNELSLTGN
jgi:hypothetical protein